MNLKIKALLAQLESMGPLDYAMCDRATLLRLSDAAFDVSGEADSELGERVRPYVAREEFEIN